MSVGPVDSAPLAPPAASALAGMQRAEAAVAAATAQVAAGTIDAAVILDVASAETAFATNAKVLQSGTEMTRRLLDTLA